MTDSHANATLRQVWAPQAWVGGRWQSEVLLTMAPDADGRTWRWQSVLPQQPCPPGAERLAGPVLPGLVNGHSHAFQRAFAGLAERRDAASDDFWGWRERMYRVAGQISPEDLQAIAAQLYTELLRGGYTQVCEFHYVQHQPDGRPYAAPQAMSEALIAAAKEVGIGLTLLPVVYERAGFAAPALRPDQRRFHLDADAALAAQAWAAAQGHGLLNAGVALHSLRAATPESIHTVARALRGGEQPLHMHVAEQPAEVADCLAHTGLRPVAWLAEQGLLTPAWQLVHATHVTREEIAAVAAAGATLVICPTTEANLGDGLSDLPGWLAAGVPMALGSDSQVTRSWPEELRWLDYGQRLGLQQRNVSAAPEQGQPATAARLLEAVLDGGRRSAGFSAWGLQAGARADLLVLDLNDASLAGIPSSHWLDALVFSSPGQPFEQVMVGGHWRGCAPQGQRQREDPSQRLAERQARFARVMQGLWR